MSSAAVASQELSERPLAFGNKGCDGGVHWQGRPVPGQIEPWRLFLFPAFHMVMP
jgi:hypothetical protein